MNKQLLLFGLAVACVVVFLLVSGTFEPYTKSTAFASGNNFITLDANGDIKLQPVVDVDNAIDVAAAKVSTALVNDADAKYKTKAEAAAEAQGYNNKFQTKFAAKLLAAAATHHRKQLQPKGDYVRRNTNYKIWTTTPNMEPTEGGYMYGGGSGTLAWNDPTGENMKGKFQIR